MSDVLGESRGSAPAPEMLAPLPGEVDLVLEGGGVKGIALVGAIAVLEERGFSFSRVAGTSAGAIVGSLVAAGMKSPALYDLMIAVDYTRFCDEPPAGRLPIIGKGFAIFFDHGMYKGDYFHGWIREHLAGLGVRTFQDLARTDAAGELSVEERYRLVVIASDISRGRLLRLPWDYPDDGLDPGAQAVADAVRASMSVPFFFRPVLLEVANGEPSTLVDGAMLSNFPVGVFDRVDGRPPRWPTLGIKLSARHKPHQVEHVVNGEVSLAMAMLGTMQSWSDHVHLDDPAVTARTIFVDTLGVNVTDFAIGRAKREELYQQGRTAAERFLSA